MKKLIITLLAALFAFSALADQPVRRTIVVKDGKVITDNVHGPITSELLGGKRAYLGVSLNDISPELREHFGSTKQSGVLVESVAAGSPAEKAGLRTGDIIVSVDGNDVAWSGDIRRELRDKKDGESVRIEILRGRARQTLVASIIEKEGPRVLLPRDIEMLTEKIGRNFDGSEWHARVERLGDCSELQSRIKELENRLKDLEKRLK